MVFRGQTLGKYRIIEPLGSGGFGTVYLAEDTWIDKRVAIKVPHRQSLDFASCCESRGCSRRSTIRTSSRSSRRRNRTTCFSS
jgi:serine/threonine protein kinase